MSINDASLANLKHFEGKWQSGPTRTIRVPIALADVTLEYARQLDKGIESSDTSDSSDELSKLKDEVKRLQNELSQVAAPSPENELPDPLDILNDLRAERKKTKADKGDIEAILRIIEKSWQTHPDGSI